MSRTRTLSIIAILGTSALVALVGACTEDDPCDEGQILVDGWCNLASVDAAPPAMTDDAAVPDTSDPEAGVSEAGGGAATAFGQTCMTSVECPAPTNYCALVPGQPSGNCTATGCNLDASICPAGWTCMDLTMYVGQHICVPPGTPGV